MALFEVKGWDLKQKEIVSGDQSKSKKKKKAKKNEPVDLKAVKSVDLDEKVSKKNDKRTPQRENKRKNNEDDVPRKKAKAPSDTKKEKVKSKEPENAPAKTDAPKPAAPIMSLRGKLTPLQQKMMAKLSGSRFRWINEQLYTISSVVLSNKFFNS